LPASPARQGFGSQRARHSIIPEQPVDDVAGRLGSQFWGGDAQALGLHRHVRRQPAGLGRSKRRSNEDRLLERIAARSRAPAVRSRTQQRRVDLGSKDRHGVAPAHAPGQRAVGQPPGQDFGFRVFPHDAGGDARRNQGAGARLRTSSRAPSINSPMPSDRPTPSKAATICKSSAPGGGARPASRR
jgi:hypothetical protein